MILFKTRPEFSNPTDANADGVYELELTKTDSTGFSVSQVVNIEVRQADESEQKPIEAPGTSLVLEITEQTDSLTDDNGSNRNIVGTDEADVFSKQDLENGSKYVSGGLGDDVFSAGDDFLTGGEGSDTFLISLDRIVDLNQLGIVDNSQPYEEGRKEGIYGYDQNRDGTLDLATELDHAWLNVIYDFTPGTDKLGLSTYGWTGTNVPSLRSEDVSYIQGTGDKKHLLKIGRAHV